MIKYDLYDDMLAQPHLLIAGATGSGKSVIVNALIYQCMFDSPQNKQLILIDPKRVELAEYRNVSHCIAYESEPENMINILQYAMSVCESRYQLMQKNGVRLYPGGDTYVIIDEFADLMLTQKKNVKQLVQRLAQIGRAAKVHVILCTQTPISAVLPTEIKVNFDARVGLRTRSAQDSRNILGFPGCEQLPRYGQGYYMKPEGVTLYNIPMIPDADRIALINHWKKPTKPTFKEKIKRLFS